ncbi:hypothetical protein GCM10010280_55070 [Streptomyces pilosus]|uniref:Uncharacterized protein n=1 Tax=Streptomyces pilosus TaxID=28893 RepID=A0A918F1X8_9ACTN|nr:hypothetical protein GCM10010280_55070 [Streptomyces pilosus]
MDVADAVLADGDAYAQVDEQAGEPAARGDPHRDDGHEQHDRADEQQLVEVVDSQRPFPSLTQARRRVSSRTSRAIHRFRGKLLRYLT